MGRHSAHPIPLRDSGKNIPHHVIIKAIVSSAVSFHYVKRLICCMEQRVIIRAEQQALRYGWSAEAAGLIDKVADDYRQTARAIQQLDE